MVLLYDMGESDSRTVLNILFSDLVKTRLSSLNATTKEEKVMKAVYFSKDGAI